MRREGLKAPVWPAKAAAGCPEIWLEAELARVEAWSKFIEDP